MRMGESKTLNSWKFGKEAMGSDSRKISKELRASLEGKVNLSRHLERKSMASGFFPTQNDQNHGWFEINREEFYELVQLLQPPNGAEQDIKKVHY